MNNQATKKTGYVINSLGELLTSVRIGLNLDQKQFAIFLGVSLAALSKYERNKSHPDRIATLKIKQKIACHLSPEEFLLFNPPNC